MYNKVTLIEGVIAVDDRGQLLFCNDFDMKAVRRFYLVSNHASRFIRAWHAHKEEAKFVLVVYGAALVAGVKIDDWDCPDKNAEVHRYILSDKKPGILVVPPGYANGFMTLVPNTQVMFFSTVTSEQNKDDDYRFDAYYWNPWEITQR
ncbi:MAG: dTDP-4-dehydrorhamnose 3,5-epimerase family protein [Desulfobacteraceae bacterium]|nr:dTDP-4-dehydrorhamnose 3,5-epimerase family protein [Desulfobacteraceae bacterium]